MDDLFVKRPRGSDSSDPEERENARRMVQQILDVALDEDPGAESLSPDEKRLRNAGKKPPGDQQLRSAGRNSPSAEVAGAGEALDFDTDDIVKDVQEEGFVDVDLAPANLEAPEEPVVEALFARRRDAPARMEGKAVAPETEQKRGLADDLFSRRQPRPVASTSSDQVDKDLEAQDSGEDDVGDDTQTEDEGVRCMFLRRCCSFERCSFEFDAYVPSKTTVAKCASCLLLFVGVFGTVTWLLGTACEDQAAFKQVCISQGVVQWIIAVAPCIMFSFCFIQCARTWYRSKEKVKAAAWQNDEEAQKSAAELLDTLAVAPEADRHKYASQAVQILTDFPDKPIIQYKGCAALESICRAQRGNVQHVHASGAIPIILKALDTHPRVRKVQTAGLGALACLAKISKKQIYDVGGIETICRSMAKFKRDPTVQVSGAMTLGALCLSSAQNRHSVARFGGVQLLLQALQRHVERADVQIACSETLALISQDNTALAKQLVASLPVVQGIAERYEGARGMLKGGGSKKAKDIEIVLRSLRKLEAALTAMTEIDDQDAASDVATPRLEGEEGANTARANGNHASELMGRTNQWSKFNKDDKQ